MVHNAPLLALVAPLLGAASAGRVPHKRADLNVCGVKGWDRGIDNANYDYNDSGKYSTYSACSARCAASKQCKSFGYGGKLCMLFNIPLANNFDADSDSPYVYWDAACPAAASVSAAATTTTTKAATSSTTKAASSLTTPLPTASPVSTSTTTTTATTTATTTTTVVVTMSTTTTVVATTCSACTTAPAVATTTKPTSTSVPTVPAVSTTKTTTTKASTTTSVPTVPAVSTTKAVATTTTAKASTSTVSIPASCTNVQPTVQITSFSWFNSTHNLDCASANYPSDAQVCWNSTSLCNAGDSGCICTPYCYTGLPAVAYQPLGFGPADTINVGLDGAASTCSAQNPMSFRNNEIGGGHFDCGTAADVMGFNGDSNKDSGNFGSIYYNSYYNTCGSLVPRYEATFPLLCSHDAGMNATCTAQLPVVMTLVSLS